MKQKIENIFYFYLMDKIKGGFPPIKYCSAKIDLINKKDVVNKKVLKERSFASSINKNVNIKQILNNSVNKPQFNIPEDKKDELQIVSDF